jgi:predicted transcriptional regulator
MKYRGRADIISAILETISRGSTNLTRIMYGSLISYIQAKEYLTFLEKKGLIRHDTPSATYSLTEEGAKVLGKLRELESILSIEEPPTSSDGIGIYNIAEPLIRSRRVTDNRELDNRPIVSA